MGNTIGERIAELRKESNLSQIEFAEKLNISDKAVSKWEVNKCDPSLDLIVAMSELFNCSVDYIVKGSEHEIQTMEMQHIKNLDKMFNKVLEIVKTEVSEEDFETVFKQIIPLTVVQKTLVLGTLKEGIYKKIINKNLQVLFNAINKVSNHIKAIEFKELDWNVLNDIKEALCVCIKNQSVEMSTLHKNLGRNDCLSVEEKMEDLGFISRYYEKTGKVVYITKERFEKIYGEKL